MAGRVSFKPAAGQRKLLPIHLSARTRRQLTAGRGLSALATAVSTHGLATTRTTHAQLMLEPARTRPRKNRR